MVAAPYHNRHQFHDRPDRRIVIQVNGRNLINLGIFGVLYLAVRFAINCSLPSIRAAYPSRSQLGHHRNPLRRGPVSNTTS